MRIIKQPHQILMQETFLKYSYLCFSLTDIPSSFMMLIGIMIHLCARKRVYRGRGQGDICPVGPVGFTGFGARLDLLLLSSLPTYERKGVF